MIGRLLQLYRVTQNITMREMGEILGISAATISRIEHGREIDSQTMIKIMNWLFTGRKPLQEIKVSEG